MGGGGQSMMQAKQLLRIGGGESTNIFNLLIRNEELKTKNRERRESI